jgi:protein arginine kinase
MNLRQFLFSEGKAAPRLAAHRGVVLSSRVRLARNLSGYPFPGWAKKAERVRVCEHVRGVVESLPQMAGGFSESMDTLTQLEKDILVERHLISREHAVKGAGSALVLSPDQLLSVMINEEDHLRMQCLRPGFKLQEAWQALDQADTGLEQQIQYAFSPRWGYLTACPTNLGTAIRVSAMLHLPALVLSEQISQIIQAVNKLGLAVRGFYGEGTEALGNVYQVSNQMTLGETEKAILDRLTKVVAQIVDHEENARGTLMERKRKVVLNHVGRAYGVLSNAHSISSKEAMNLLSLMSLGADLGMFPGMDCVLLQDLFLTTQPAHLRLCYGEKLSPDERDVVRADLAREKLAAVGRPVPPPQSGRLDKSSG